MLTTVQGLVVKEYDYGENDRFIKILTDEYGIVDVSVKGARKNTSSNNSPTSLFAYSKFCYNNKNGRNYLNSCEPIHIFYGLRLDVTKLALACYFSETMEYAITTEKTPDGVMRLMLNSLHFLEKGTRENEFIKSVFELRFMSDIGHLPQLIGCAHCYSYDDTDMYFLIENGMLLCGKHFHDKLDISYYNVSVSPSLLHTIRYICLVEMDKLFNFKISDEIQKELTSISEKYLLRHLSVRSFKSLDYYNNLFNI